jgi:hypothetical protein
MEATLVRAPAARAEELARLSAAYPNLPEQYLRLLEQSNGAEGDLGVEPGWFVVWPAEEALVATGEYELPKYLPGYFAFGGNGGGELFVFELLRGSADRTVFMVPAIGMASSELRVVARTFAEFHGQLGRVLRSEA